MYSYDNTETDFDEIVDAETPWISTLNVNNTDFQNQTIEEINENNIFDDDIDKDFIDFMLKESPEQLGEYLVELTASNEPSQLTTTNILFHDEAETQHSSENSNHAIELIQLDRIDETWKNLTKILHENENRLTQRNVPRLIVLNNDHAIYYMNCTLYMLLNAPVFIRLVRKLQRVLQRNAPNLQLIHNITHPEIDLFSNLSKIVEMSFEENENDDANISALQSFRDKYEALFSHTNDWIQQDPDEFYNHLMNLLQLVAHEMNETESFSKAFEIRSSVSINDGGSTVEKDHTIRILTHDDGFSQYIDEHYTSTVLRRDNGDIIEQKYELLPEQIWATAERQQNSNTILYPYPTEFKTRCNQRYLFTGAVSLNCDRYITVVRRQDCVYLFNGHRLFDRFRIDYLSTFFKTVHGRVLLYTEVDPSCEYVCTFEDPLLGMHADKPYHESSDHSKTKNLLPSIQFNTSVTSTGVPSVIIRHPILSTFRYYMHSDFRRDNINIRIPMLNDCLNQDSLYFWPRSMFVGSSIECTLVFKAPDGHFYRSHYEFVRNGPSGVEFENPTYFCIENDNASNDEWFRLKLTISKSKQDVLQTKDEHMNGIDQHNYRCQIVRYPDGKIVKIDEEKLLSFTKEEHKKKDNKRKPSNNSPKVTPFRLSKVVDLNTIHLVLRPAHFLPDENRYVLNSDAVFYSNAFKPVSSSVKKFQYDYSSDSLQITELSPLRITLFNETDTCTIHLSYLIPEMYKCTSLKDKCIQVTILTGTDEEPRVHPIYQILVEQNRVSSMKFPVNEYSSTLTIPIVKRAMAEFHNDSGLTQTFNDPSTSQQTIPTLTHDSLQRISTSPSMSNFRIKLELYHVLDDQLIIYPKSTAMSKIIIDKSVSQERQVFPELLEINDTESNDILIDQPPSHIKRLFDEEVNVFSNISSMKSPKIK